MLDKRRKLRQDLLRNHRSRGHRRKADRPSRHKGECHGRSSSEAREAREASRACSWIRGEVVLSQVAEAPSRAPRHDAPRPSREKPRRAPSPHEDAFAPSRSPLDRACLPFAVRVPRSPTSRTEAVTTRVTFSGFSCGRCARAAFGSPNASWSSRLPSTRGDARRSRAIRAGAWSSSRSLRRRDSLSRGSRELPNTSSRTRAGSITTG